MSPRHHCHWGPVSAVPSLVPHLQRGRPVHILLLPCFSARWQLSEPVPCFDLLLERIGQLPDVLQQLPGLPVPHSLPDLRDWLRSQSRRQLPEFLPDWLIPIHLHLPEMLVLPVPVQDVCVGHRVRAVLLGVPSQHGNKHL